MTPTVPMEAPAGRLKYTLIAILALVMLAFHFVLAYGLKEWQHYQNWPLFVAYALGGVPVVAELLFKALRREFGSDLLAGISIVVSIFLEEYLAGVFVILMVSTGETIERFAIRSASSVLEALSRRMPAIAHCKRGDKLEDIAVESIAADDLITLFPHEIAPVDGVVVEGHGSMDESFLTGEPYRLSKTPGSTVISGALNGESALTIRATKRAVDSRYAQIMQVMRVGQGAHPQMRRLGDMLGAYYTPLALGLALLAFAISTEPRRFLAVIVAATPCPLLIAIPVAIVGAISLSARRGIIVKKPAVLEQIGTCRTLIFDKTGTLTYGQPKVSEVLNATGFTADEVLRLAAGLERYSKHPLAVAILDAAETKKLTLPVAQQISEKPGQGLVGQIEQQQVRITSRNKLAAQNWGELAQLPPQAAGLECVVLVDEKYAATLRFRDQPRQEGRSFVDHLGPKHSVQRILIVSGDRQIEVEHLAKLVGITEIYAEQSPEQKLEIVKRETALAPTMYVGDGINDAPALAAATVGIAFGAASDITGEAAGAVIMDSSLEKVDEFFHIGTRMRRIALQSAVGGMAVSLIGMIIAACGWLPPTGGAILQEVIDVVAVLNAVRVAIPPKALSDFRK